MRRIWSIVLVLLTVGATAQDIILSGQQLTATDESSISAFLIREIPDLQRTNSGLILFHEVRSSSASHLTYRQSYLGTEIYGTEVKVHVKANGTVNHYTDQTVNVRKWRTGFMAQKNNSTLHQSIANAYVATNYGPNTTFEYDLVIHPDEPQLCVRAQVHDPNVAAYDEVLLNMRGEAVVIRDTRVFATDSIATVPIFNPDPLTSARVLYGSAYIDNGDLDGAALNAEIQYHPIEVTFDTGVFFLYNPQIAILDTDSPGFAVATSDTTLFSFTRSQPGFEQTNTLFHITKFSNYVDSLVAVLGCTPYPDTLVHSDVQGLYTDNSFYQPGTIPLINFGIGGVDDAEDADVIIHEFGHVLSGWASPGTNIGQERKAVDEGIGDYFAASYSKSISDYRWCYIFNWDGHNEYWPGRELCKPPSQKKLPDHKTGNIHLDGEILASALMDIQAELGRELTDALVLESLFSYGSNMAMKQAAFFLQLADNSCFGGANYFPIYTNLVARGLLNKQDGFCSWKPDAGPDLDLVKGSSYSVTLGGDTTNIPFGAEYYWWPNNGLNDRTIPHPTANVSEAGMYILYVRDTFNCLMADTVNINFIDIKEFSVAGTEQFAADEGPLWVTPPTSDGDVRVDFYNVIGQWVQGTTYHTDQTFMVEHRELPRGVYFMRLQTDSYVATQKLVKLK